ncbi:unnamed protein product [Urochloa humidicola]
MSFYFDRLEAARRQQQRMVPAGVGGCTPPPRPWPCYQHAAALLPLAPPPLPVPASLHAGEGRGSGRAGEEAGAGGGGRDAWRGGGSAAVAGIGAAVPAAAAAGGGRWVERGVAPAREEEEAGGVGGGEVRNKRCSPAPAPLPGARSPPPKRRAVAAFRRFPLGCGRGDAAAATSLPVPGDSRSGPAPPPPTLAGGKDSVLFEAAGTTATAAAGSSARHKVSAADGAPHCPGAALLKPSEALGKNSVAAADALGNDTASESGDQSLKSKDDLVVTPTRVLPKPSMVSAYRRFPPGCRRPAAPLLAGGGSSQMHSPPSVQAVPEDRDVAAVCSGTEDGAAKDEGLEEGEIASEGQQSPTVTLHDEAATSCRDGASSSEEMIGNARQCEAESKSGGSSCNVVAAESLSQRLPKEHPETESVSECAMDTASSGAAAGVSDEGATMRKKVMFTPRKSVKPPKSIQKPAPNTHGVSFSKEAEQEETELGRHSTNGIEDTDDFTKDRAMLQDPIPMSADKCPWTNKRKEAATVSHYFGPKKKKVKAKEDPILKDDEVSKALAAVYEGKFEPGQTQGTGI